MDGYVACAASGKASIPRRRKAPITNVFYVADGHVQQFLQISTVSGGEVLIRGIVYKDDFTGWPNLAAHSLCRVEEFGERPIVDWDDDGHRGPDRSAKGGGRSWLERAPRRVHRSE